MNNDNIRYIIGSTPIPIDQIPDAHEKRRSYVRRPAGEKTPLPPPVTMTTLYGIKIQPLAGLGEKIDKGSMWKTVFGALQIGQGFEIPKKDFGKVRNAVLKYNKQAKALWKSSRKFIFERGVNAKGEADADVGRVGRIQ